jgi:LysR family glycine cleavage system transcriptional activator
MPASLPPLNGLLVFEAAARHLSFTRAAAELNVTQTAVSHQIRRLEEQLGLRLFVRRNRALELTREAREYLPAVRAAFQDLRVATQRLLHGKRDDVLTVSTIVSVAAKWLVPRLAAFQETHPEIEVRIATGTRLVDFRREEVDVAIRYGRGHWPGLRADWLMAEELFPVCAPSLLTGPKPLNRPEDLVHHTLLHVELGADEWQLWLTATGLPPRLATQRGMRFDDRLMALQAAMDGLGVAIGHAPLVEADIAAGRLVVPFDAYQLPAEAGYYLVGPHETADLTKIVTFRTWLLAAAHAKGALQIMP